MAARGVFPDVAIKMVEVGESTGALQDMLNSLADFYDEEIETNLARFVTLVEPVLLVVMGIVIAGAAAGALHAALPACRRYCAVMIDRCITSQTQRWRHRALARATRRLYAGATEAPSTTADHAAEIAQARRLAERYRLEFVDMDSSRSTRSCSARFPPT